VAGLFQINQMAILTKSLEINKYYFICDIENKILEINKCKLINIIFDKEYNSIDYDDYVYMHTYMFEKYKIDCYDMGTKVGWMFTGRFILADNMKKVIDVLKNSIIHDYNHIYQKNISYNNIKELISDIETNHPELFI